jgi:hypothetical protein
MNMLMLYQERSSDIRKHLSIIARVDVIIMVLFEYSI